MVPVYLCSSGIILAEMVDNTRQMLRYLSLPSAAVCKERLYLADARPS
jgi:hypothetical protein